MLNNMTKIKSVYAREILDSRGNPTVEVVCTLSSGAAGRFSVPSGASTGIHEALELRDGDAKRYNGKGVLKAVKNVNTKINLAIKGKKFDQKTLDQTLLKLDGTPNKAKLGANAILGVSVSFARACANEMGIPVYKYLGKLVKNNKFKLPVPALNIINGGQHADSGMDIQEFMIAPVGFPSFKRKVQAGAEVIVALKKLLKEKGYSTSVGDEGGFAPKLGSNEEALELIVTAIEKAGYTSKQIKIALDVASSSFYEGGSYNLKIGGVHKKLDSAGMIEWYKELVNKYPIVSIEDGLAEDDWDGWTALVKELGKKIMLVGDDLLVTNVSRIKTAIEKKSANALLVKLNQIGSLSETIEAINMAKEQGWMPFISHRSGETTDTFIADLAAGLSCGYIKSGSLVRGERVCKYNRLMEIEEQL
jgi:enolase